MSQTAPLLFGTGWLPVRDGDPRAGMLFDRHYSARQYRDGRIRQKIMGPGEYLLLLLAPTVPEGWSEWKLKTQGSGTTDVLMFSPACLPSEHQSLFPGT